MGLPIGPELPSVLGNALLQPLDVAVTRLGHTYYRYMDDFVVLGDDLPTEAVVAQVDETLEALSLQRNEGKTKTYPPGRAGEALQDMLLAYIDPNGETTDRKMSEPELLDLLQAEAEADCPNPKRVRYVLRRLGEGSGVPALVSNPNLTNADPHFTCAYIARHGLRQQETREELVRLSWTPGRRVRSTPPARCVGLRSHELGEGGGAHLPCDGDREDGAVGRSRPRVAGCCPESGVEGQRGDGGGRRGAAPVGQARGRTDPSTDTHWSNDHLLPQEGRSRSLRGVRGEVGSQCRLVLGHEEAPPPRKGECPATGRPGGARRRDPRSDRPGGGCSTLRLSDRPPRRG